MITKSDVKPDVKPEKTQTSEKIHNDASIPACAYCILAACKLGLKVSLYCKGGEVYESAFYC